MLNNNNSNNSESVSETNVGSVSVYAALPEKAFSVRLCPRSNPTGCLRLLGVCKRPPH